MPLYFRHSNINSFTRQLGNYNFYLARREKNLLVCEHRLKLFTRDASALHLILRSKSIFSKSEKESAYATRYIKKKIESHTTQIKEKEEFQTPMMIANVESIASNEPSEQSVRKFCFSDVDWSAPIAEPVARLFDCRYLALNASALFDSDCAPCSMVSDLLRFQFSGQIRDYPEYLERGTMQHLREKWMLQ